MKRGWTSALACMLVTLAVALTALGRDRPVVLLVVDGQGGALVSRLTAELEGLGFAVVRGTAAGGSLATQAKARGAQAAVRVPRSRRALSVWVTDAAGTRDAARETEITGIGVEDDVFTVRSVELLRAAFLEIDVAMPPLPPIVGPAPSATASASSTPNASSSTSASPAPAASTEPSTPSRPLPPLTRAPATQHRLSVAGGASSSPGGVPFQAHLAIGVTKALGSDWWAGLWSSTPGIGGALAAREGEADVRSTYVGAELARGPERGPWRWSVGAGPGVVWLRSSGRASAPNATGQVDDALLPWAYARAGTGYAVTPRIALAADLRVGATFSKTQLLFANREVGTFGRPIVFPTLGMEVALD